MSLLARCDKSCATLRQQLLEKDFADHEVDDAIQWAQALGYLDDKRLAEAILRSQLNRLHGPAKIEQAMQLKGISKSLASEVLTAHEIDWFELALQRATKKFPSLDFSALDFQQSQKQKAKVIRHLLGQGFNYEQAGYALEATLSANKPAL
ncbi:regulatory protein RecX [Shewanella avicenniae]|uniref:Regulatory protein RecX n=1 Tax=Shewanella avicenniae TaxID=2814294 RepID=A0ABX7QVV8_9GAMM|nr:regulatory protein RecX [Shewanella avicenniae]QSX34776.1 regulatory protein RecX [Shewanella avicenniae]